MRKFLLLLVAAVNGQRKDSENDFGLKFVRVYPPHSPSEKLGILNYMCSKRMRQIAQDKLSANEQAVEFGNSLRTFLGTIDHYFGDSSSTNGASNLKMCSSYHLSGTSRQTKLNETSVPSSPNPLTPDQLRKRREALYMSKSILPKISKKVYQMAIRADRNRRAMEQIDEISIEIEDVQELSQIRLDKLDKQRKIDKIRTILRKRIDFFDIYEFLHEVGASQKLLSSLSLDDSDAITQCQNGLFKLIVRNTENCDLADRLLLESLQWFESFKQFYSCVVEKKDPEKYPLVKIKPFDDRLKAQTFLLTSLSPSQCKPRHTEC